MLKSVSTALGIGLLFLWIIGLSSPLTTGWLDWVIGFAALSAFAIAAYTPEYASKTARVGGPLLVSIGLFTAWILGIATGAVDWLCWWTVGFACSFLLLGIAAGSEKRGPLVHMRAELERERMRKSA